MSAAIERQRIGWHDMRRQGIRQLKLAVAKDQSAEAMLQLLQRSVDFGHVKLALMRCIQAEQMGICIAPEILSYCQRVADGLPPATLQRVVRQARALAA